jgi:hypothetical protein
MATWAVLFNQGCPPVMWKATAVTEDEDLKVNLDALKLSP